MDLSVENFDSLIERYVGEIEVLREAYATEAEASLRSELEQALKDSEPLVDELRIAREIFVEASSSGRALTQDEIDAFVYFGFTIDDRWKKPRQQQQQQAPAHRAPESVPVSAPPVQPPASNNNGANAFELPPQRPSDRRSAAAAPSMDKWEESETDPEAMLPQHQQRTYRALTPDYDDASVYPNSASTVAYTAARPSVAAVPVVTPSRGGSPAPLPPTSTSAPAAFTSPGLSLATVEPPPASPRYTEDDVEERARVIAQRLIAEERARLQSEFAARPPVVDEYAVQQAVKAEAQRKEQWANEMLHSVTDDYNAKLAQLEASLREARGDLVRAESEVEREHRKAEAAADSLARLRADLDVKATDLTEARRESAALRETLQREKALHDQQLNDASAAQASSARDQWIDFVRDRLVPLTTARYEPTIASLTAEVDRLRRHIDGDVSEVKRDCDELAHLGQAIASGDACRDVLEQARAALQLSARVSGAIRYTAASSTTNGVDSDALDAAVAEELNQLSLPVHVAVRRLGPHGEYFIDRRLQLRLMNGRVFVKRPGMQANAYEPLTKYVVKLYAPIFAGSNNEAFSAALHATGQVSPQADRYSHSPQRSVQHYSGAVLELSPLAAPPPTNGGRMSSPGRPATDDTAITPAERIRRLQREQQQLAEELAAQKQLLSQRQQATTPSAHSHQQQSSSYYTTTPSNAASVTPRGALTPTAARRPAGAAATTLHGHGSSSLAHLSEEEVELLKKLALAKQIRDQRRQQQVSTRSR